jgi:hypothetical protein
MAKPTGNTQSKRTGMKGRRFTTVTAGLLLLAVIPSSSRADTVSIEPSRDNTLYEDPGGALSNGAGEYLFAGFSALTTSNARRAVLAFDVAGAVPAGATIDSATLTLHMSMAPLGAPSQVFTLHRLTAAWGEGSSDAAFQEGGGAASTANDATWLHTFFDTELWAQAGGDFDATPRAAVSVGSAVGFYTWGPTQQLRDDVQGWLDDPATNFGWLVRGNESQLQTARRFGSRNNLNAALRPSLAVEFTVAAGGGAGRVPDGATAAGAPLTARLEPGGDLTLSWDVSCNAGDSDYEVYAGTIGGVFDDHDPVACSTAGATTATFTPAVGDRYYLVVPRNAGQEGSYGTSSAGVERPSGASTCLSQAIDACP